VRAHPVNEFMHILDGGVRFAEPDGSVVSVERGDAVFVPLGAAIGWESSARVAKYYVVQTVAAEEESKMSPPLVQVQTLPFPRPPPMWSSSVAASSASSPPTIWPSVASRWRWSRRAASVPNSPAATGAGAASRTATRELPMATKSIDLWEQFSAETGEDTGFTRCGLLYLSNDDEEIARWAAWGDFAKTAGVTTYMLDAKQAAERGHATGRAWKGGVFSPTDGTADPARPHRPWRAPS
jgi:hypothetical protein